MRRLWAFASWVCRLKAHRYVRSVRGLLGDALAGQGPGSMKLAPINCYSAFKLARPLRGLWVPGDFCIVSL